MKTNQFILSAKMKNIMNVRTWYALSLRMLLLSIFIMVLSGFSQEVAESDNLTSIESILNSDFNPDDARWDDKFKLSGFDFYIEAVAVAPNGNIYVGGIFDLVDGIIVNGIAMWDGEEWHSLGNGVTGGWNDGIVYAIAIDGNKVYVGGDFTEAGDVPASRIAMWDGANWNALGSGMDSEVRAIAVDGGNVYAGGYGITEAGGIAVNNIAKWDGQNWSALGNGVYNYNDLEAIAAKNDTVYAGGNFLEAGDDTVNYIAYWDGNNWHDMDGGMSGRVYSLEFYDGSLYAGGEFTEAGGDTVNYLAQWDGTEWSHVGGGVNARVFNIVTDNGNLYISGEFQRADTVEVNRLARWDGQEWSGVGTGTGYGVNTIAAYNDLVYIGGQFYEIAGKDIKYFALWDGQSWSGVSSIQDQSVDGEVYAIAIDGEDIYVGGQFIKAGGDTVNNIARWDGKNWYPLGKGLNNKVSVLVVDSGHVYAGGRFSMAGDLRVPSLAKWDGQEWSGFGDGMNGAVGTIAFHGQDMYVGGSFTKAGDKWARYIARWDGAEWHALGGDGSLERAGGVNGGVNSIAVDRDTIYVGGYFGRAYNADSFIRAKSIVKWDGENWHAIGSFGNLTQQVIMSIYVKNGIIYAAGQFPRVGDDPANKVVKWDGAEWLDIGDELYPTYNYGLIYSLVENKGRIYIGGIFDMAGDKTVNHIAEWNGQEWLSLGSGVNRDVYALAADSSYLYAGGIFTMAGQNASAFVGRYDISGVVGVSNNIINIPEKYFLYQNYPNPFNPATKIQFRLPKLSEVKIEVFNILGQKVDILLSRYMSAGFHEIEFNAQNLSSGVYLYRIQADNFQEVKKMILLK